MAVPHPHSSTGSGPHAPCAHGTLPKWPTAGSAHPSAHAWPALALRPTVQVVRCHTPSPALKPPARAMARGSSPWLPWCPSSGSSRRGRDGAGGNGEPRRCPVTGPQLGGGMLLVLLGPLLHCSPSWGAAAEKPLTTLPSRAGAGPCGAGEVACDSGSCIRAELACDFTESCTDGSDEKRCGETRGRAPGTLGARHRMGPGRGGDPGTPWLVQLGDPGARAAPGQCSSSAGLYPAFCRSNHLRSRARGLARRQCGAAALGRAEGHQVL